MSAPEKAFINMLKDHMRGMSERERLAYIVRFLWRSDYGWGKEIISDVDCSGSVSFALYLMGYNIRITAHDIYNMLCNRANSAVPEPGDLIFFKGKNDARMRHVAVFSDNEVLLNAARKFEDIHIDDEIQYRLGRGQDELFRGRIDWGHVAEVAKDGKYAYGIDTELKPLFGLFSEESLNG